MTDESDEVSCSAHGKASATYVCGHLTTNPAQRWHGDYPSEKDPWPDAWCNQCNEAFLREGEWNEKNTDCLDLKILCSHCYEEAKGASVDRLEGAALDAWRSLVDLCNQEMHQKQDALKRRFSLGTHKRWDWDQERRELVFSNDGVPAVIAGVEFAGSVSTKTDTWLWSWANRSILETVRSRITAVRDFGERRDFPRLTVPKWPAEEADGWEMAAVALHILDGQGVYRTPGDAGFTFMVLTEVRFAQ
jgi:hypothetical protein